MRKEFPLKLKYPSTVEALRGFSFRTRSLLAILTLLLDCNCVPAQIKAQAVLQLATEVNTAMTYDKYTSTTLSDQAITALPDPDHGSVVACRRCHLRLDLPPELLGLGVSHHPLGLRLLPFEAALGGSVIRIFLVDLIGGLLLGRHHAQRIHERGRAGGDRLAGLL